jgi:3-oxoacyl-[acyl-carrier-protein] synthase-3
MSLRSVIRSCGLFLPEKIVTNADLEKIVDTTDEWIVQRTGIHERRIADKGQATSDLAIRAGRAALEKAGLSGAEIDTVIVCTSTPDQIFPSVAVRVQAALGIGAVGAFDLNAACSGFVYGLSVADAMILSGKSKRLLLIGAEKMSSILNWEDRATCVLFGDGAGAIVLEADESGAGTLDDRGIHSTHLFANGALKDILYVNGGPSTTGDSGFIVMEGKKVFIHAVSYMADVVHAVLERNKIRPDQIDWLVPHQANIRIIEATAKKLDMPMEKVVVTVGRHGNTSAASIPLALCEAVADGRIKRGDMILFEALGAGLTWGAVLARF